MRVTCLPGSRPRLTLHQQEQSFQVAYFKIPENFLESLSQFHEVDFEPILGPLNLQSDFLAQLLGSNLELK